MTSRRRMLWSLLLGAGLALPASVRGLAGEPRPGDAEDLPNGSATKVDYLKDVKPIFVKRCQVCHGPLKQKAGLRLDAAQLLKQGGESGSPIEPGHAEESLLIDHVTAASATRMPPKGEGEPLTADEIATLTTWINQGAVTPEETPLPNPRDHWAFRPPHRPLVPQATIASAADGLHPIDTFLSVQQTQQGITPRPLADRATQLRRVTLDLTGLIPSRATLREFLDDPRDDAAAYAAAVEKLLASPQYGERWGRHWMDIWRYADWAGYNAEVRESQPHIWHWRDWIIESLNHDKGYDRMILEMIAGDELAPDDADIVRATGYLVRNWYKFNRNVWLDATIEHTSKAFLGITLNCAKCHDHKYDPIDHAEYYRMRAFFEPHEIRTDRLPGQPDTAADGIPRVYDAQPEAKTYLFTRGNEAEPDKSKALDPAVPAVLGGPKLAIAPITLPLTGYQPGVRPFVREEERGKARLAETTAQEHARQARKAETDAAAKMRASAGKPTIQQAAEFAARLRLARAQGIAAEHELGLARARLAALEARIAAEDARFAAKPDPAATSTRALAAASAEKQAAIRAAEFELAQSQQQRAALDTPEEIAKAKPDARAKSIAQAETKIQTARLAVHQAEFASLSASRDYTPLGPAYPNASTGRRLALARWIASPENPLTARVAVNHLWTRHFGAPLVSTVTDFGLNGKPPTHPELLDWLASEFVRQGWSMKAMHRLIVTSHAYRRVSSAAGLDDPNLQRDPGNLTYWRMNTRRMEAELVRDNVLELAGKLDVTMGGPDLGQDLGLTTYRRSIYYRHANEKQMTFLRLFDAAGLTECYRRTESIVPQQALALANSSLVREQSRKLTARLESELGDLSTNDESFLSALFETVLSRGPSTEERSACLSFLQQETTSSKAPPTAQAGSSQKQAVSPMPPAADPHRRARERLAHVLLNHNDFVTIR